MGSNAANTSRKTSQASPTSKPPAKQPQARPATVSREQQAEKVTCQCPACSATLKIPSSAVGKQVRCPKCSETFAVNASPQLEISPRTSPSPQPSFNPPETTQTTFEPFGDDNLFGSLPGDLNNQAPDNFGTSGEFQAPASTGYQPYAPPPKRKKKKRRTNKGWQAWLTETDLLLKLFGIVGAVSFGLSAIPVLGVVVFILVLVSYAVVQMAGGIWLVVVAFQEEPVQGILYILVPFYALFYLITRWDTCRVPFMMCIVSVFSLICSGLGVFAGSILYGLIAG
ncbi:MAG TPA: hypothetical protein DDW52_08670 [Planctomycetaceae bacterium]|nr:hypothetical protein [Planctomycetaceae bacterium]